MLRIFERIRNYEELTQIFHKGTKFVVSAIILFFGMVGQLGWASTPPIKGGTFVYNLEDEPPSIHPLTTVDVYSAKIRFFTCGTLLKRDSEDYSWRPNLAEAWSVSEDGKIFTFTLRKDLFFHDGTPIMAEDVKFSFDTIKDPAYEGQTAHLLPYFENFEKVEVVNPTTIKITTKDTYFKNFETAANSTFIIPKHIYKDVKKSMKLTKSIVCSGPYKVETVERGQRITLKRFDKWYGNNEKEPKGLFNFDVIDFKFFKEETVQIEHLKKGDIDYLEFRRPDSYVKEAEGAPFGKSIFKYQVENYFPKSYGFIGWNFQKVLFQDRNVRLALAYLLDREEMNKKFRFSLSELTISPVLARSEYAPPDMKPILFNSKKALELLEKSGWKDLDKNGILEKEVNGTKVELKFTLLYPNKDVEKYLLLYKEDLKKSGIEMELKYMEWNAFLKAIHEDMNFDAAALAWGGGDLDPDPKQIWHSSNAVKGGSNFISYKNPEVDKLIDEARHIMDKSKRVKLLREVYRKITEDAPYAFLFNEKYFFYANSDRVAKPSDTTKYDIGVYDPGIFSWWMQPK